MANIESNRTDSEKIARVEHKLRVKAAVRRADQETGTADLVEPAIKLVNRVMTTISTRKISK